MNLCIGRVTGAQANPLYTGSKKTYDPLCEKGRDFRKFLHQKSDFNCDTLYKRYVRPLKNSLYFGMMTFTLLDWGNSLQWINLRRFAPYVKGAEYATTLGCSTIESIDALKVIGNPYSLVKQAWEGKRVSKEKVCAFLVLITNVTLVAWSILSSMALFSFYTVNASALGTLLLVSLLFACHSYFLKSQNPKTHRIQHA